MKKTLLSIAFLVAFFPSWAHLQVNNSYWILSAGTIKPSIASWSLTLSNLSGNGAGCASVSNTGLVGWTACSSGGSTFATTSISATYPILWNTSTAVISTAISSSTLTATSPLTGSFAQVGTGGALGIQAASASQTGSMAAVDYSRLYTATTTFSSPLSYSLSTNAVTCPTCQTSGSAWPFTPSTNFGVSVQSTSTPGWFTTGVQASSTSQFVNANFWGDVNITGTATTTSLATDNLVIWPGGGGTLVSATIDASGINGQWTYILPDTSGTFCLTGTCPILLGTGFQTIVKRTVLSSASTTLFTANGAAWFPTLATPAGTFLAVDPNGKLIATSTPAVGGSGTVTQVNTTYPVTGGPFTTSGTIALAFGTTTANTWSGLQTFNNSTSTLISGTTAWYTTFIGALTGNASTASTLATTRAINGVNFDGSAPITITAASSTMLTDPHVFTALNTFGNATSTLFTSTTSWIGTLNLTNALTVANGGTGAATLTGCLTGNGTSPVTGSGTCNTSAATVTSITGGTGLNGGTITTSGTLNLKSYTATSTADTTGQVLVFTSTNATPATYGGDSDFTFTNGNLLTATNASSTLFASGTIWNSGLTAYKLIATDANDKEVSTSTIALSFFPNIAANSVLGNITGSAAAVGVIATSSLYSMTGSGSMVNSNAPTLTGLLTLTSASSTNLTVSSGPVNANNVLPFYMASSTWGTGTTTIEIMNNISNMTWKDARCHTSAGTLETRLYTDTVNNIMYWSASTTINTLTFGTNNVLSTATTTYMDIGNAASSPTSINCTLEYQYNGS